MRCASCGSENPASKKFCGDCGAELSNRCPKCRAENPQGQRFCGDCGAALGAATRAAAAPARSATRITDLVEPAGELDGERKTVTALFADIKGSTELEQDLDPEEARAIVDPALKLMIAAVHRYDGYVVQSTGDGIFAIFGAPVAHEDHPQRALYASMRMQDGLRRYSARLVADGGNPLQCRVGVNTGEVVVRFIATGGGHVEYTPIGHTTNLASRMQVVAPVGSIAVAEPTRKLCEGYFALRPLGPTRVKGLSDPVNVYEATGLGPLRTRLQRSAGRGLTKFVGREREMEAMAYAGELAKAGRGQLVAAIAEAGTGKSRPFFEFKAKNQLGWMVLEAVSVSHGKASAYLPVVDLLHGYFRILADDDARIRREKVTGRVLALDRALEDSLPYLLGLLGVIEYDLQLAQMDAQIFQRRSLDAIKRILVRESLNQPLMLIFEDLHWIDDETQALLNMLADSIANAKVLLPVNYRPEYSHEWGGKTYYTQLRLDPLGRELADEMLTSLLGADEKLSPLKNLITEKTEGNPFFMEEIVNALYEDGALVRNGAAKLVKPLDAVRIPTTVQGVLAARIDRLPADEKDLLQTLSVIGKEFPLALAREVVERPADDLDRMLNRLQLAEFIYEQPAAGDIEYSFKHALTHQVAYDSVLIERRKVMHGKIGVAIESVYVESPDDHVAELARHFDRAADADKASHYFDLAGRQTLGRAAMPDALGHASRGIELLARLPESSERLRREISLELIRGGALSFIKGPGSEERGKSLERARELSIRAGIDNQIIAINVGVAQIQMFRGEILRAEELGREAIAMAQATEFQGPGYASLGRILLHAGKFQESAACLERALELPEVQDFQLQTFLAVRRAGILTFLCNALWYLGFPDQAMIRSREAMQLAHESNDLLMRAVVLNFCADFFIQCGHKGYLRECVETLAGAADELEGLAGGLMRLMDIRRGWMLVDQGEVEEGVRTIQKGFDLRPRGNNFHYSFQRALLARALVRAGRIDEAFQNLDDAREFVERSGERYYEAELHRLKGEIALASGSKGDRGEIERRFRTAIQTARHQSARSLELRATTSLARLLRETGRRDEARATLAEIHGSFTEGFDTADLKDAKALLDELSG